MGVKEWSCNLMNSMVCCEESTKVTGSVTIHSRSFTIDLSNNCRGWGVTKQRQCGAAHEFCICNALTKFSEAPQLTSAEMGVLERSGIETIMMNDDGEREEMVALK